MVRSNASEMLVNTTRPSDMEMYDARWCVLAISIAGLIGFILIGNVVVLMALRASKRLPAHYPLASLAVADLLVGLFVVPMAGVRELFIIDINWLICTSWKTLDVMCCTASIMSLCLLGWERWCGITAPLSFAQRAKRARLFAGLVWPIALAVALPSAFLDMPKHHPGETRKACPDNMNVTYVILSALLSFYLPASLLVTFYLRILHTLGRPSNIRMHRGPAWIHKIIIEPDNLSPGPLSYEPKNADLFPEFPSCTSEKLQEIYERDLAAIKRFEMQLQMGGEIKMRQLEPCKNPVPGPLELLCFAFIPEHDTCETGNIATLKVADGCIVSITTHEDNIESAKVQDILPDECAKLNLKPKKETEESAVAVPAIVPEELVDIVAEDDPNSSELAVVTETIPEEEYLNLVAEDEQNSDESPKVVPETIPEEDPNLVAEDEQKSDETTKVVPEIVPEESVDLVAEDDKKSRELAKVVPEIVPEEEYLNLIAEDDPNSGGSAKVVPEILPEESVDLDPEEGDKSGESEKAVPDIVPEKKTDEPVVPETVSDEYEFVDLLAVRDTATKKIINFERMSWKNPYLKPAVKPRNRALLRKTIRECEQASLHRTRQRRASIMIMRVMALFLVCWTPFFVTLPIDAVCECVWDPIWQWATWLGYTNSALNPLAYAGALFAFHQEMVIAAQIARSTERKISF